MTTIEEKLRLAEAALRKNGFTKTDDIWVAPSTQLKLQEQNDNLRAALDRITKYDTTTQLRRHAEKTYGLPYEEVVEMAYDNVRNEAKRALKDNPKPRQKKAAK